MNLLTTREVCEALKIHRTTLWNKVNAGTVPAPHYRLGPKSPRWDGDELERAMTETEASHATTAS